MTEERAYPLQIRGDLSPELSRWLWLVKWLLAIPHFILLILMSFAAFVIWIIAWWAILFTGRYPRVLFDFIVGVMRWWWRVSFYALRPLGTDRYPAIHPRLARRLPRRPLRRIPGAPFPRQDILQVVAARNPPLAGRNALHGHAATPAKRHTDSLPRHNRPRIRRPEARRRIRAWHNAHNHGLEQPALRRHRCLRTGRSSGANRRHNLAVPRPLPTGHLRVPHGHGTLVIPSIRLHRPPLRRLPALPPQALTHFNKSLPPCAKPAQSPFPLDGLTRVCKSQTAYDRHLKVPSPSTGEG